MTDDRHLGPRRRGDDAQDGDGLYRLDPSHQERIAVREHDHLAGAGPVALAVGSRDPAASGRHDVEQDEALGPRMHHRGEERTALAVQSPALGVLGAQVDGPFEAQMLQRFGERLDGSAGPFVHRPVDCGVSISIPGFAVMVRCSSRVDTARNNYERQREEGSSGEGGSSEHIDDSGLVQAVRRQRG